MKSMIKRLAPRSVFVKLILIFTVAAVPLYAIGFGTIWFVSRGIVAEIQRTIDDKHYFYLSSVEREITSINQLLVTLSVDNEMSLYTPRGGDFEYENFITYNNIKKRLQNIYLSSPYINDVFVVFPEIGYEITANAFSSHIYEVDCVITEYKSCPKLYSYINNDYIVYMTPSLDNTFVLGVEIRQDKIVKTLKDMRSSYPFGFFLLDTNTGRILGENTLGAMDKQVHSICVQEGIADGHIRIYGRSFVIKQLDSSDSNFTLVTYIQEKELMQNLWVFRNMFLVFVLLSATFFILMAGYVNKTVHKPLRAIVNGMKSVEQEDYDISLSYDKDDEFGYVYKRFNKMVAHTRMLIQEVYGKKIQIQQVQLKRLQSHINPHFLFNSLYIGYRMAVSGENESVAKLCKYLGDYFRFITYFSDNEVDVADELNFTRTYLNIQKLRYGERLEFTITEACTKRRLSLPVLVVQPLVENSILYGMTGATGGLHIAVSAMLEDDTLCLTVRDNGPGMEWEQIAVLYERLKVPEQPEQQSYGLWNIYWRLQYLYGEAAALLVGNHPDGGLTVSVHIPVTPAKEA